MDNKNIKNSTDLQKAIVDLEQKVRIQESAMKEELAEVKENLKPKNVLRNSFSLISETPEIKRTLIHTAIGFGLAYFFRKSDQLFNKDSMDNLVQNMVNYGIEKLEQHDPDGYVAKGIALLRKVVPPDSPYHPFLNRYQAYEK